MIVVRLERLYTPAEVAEYLGLSVDNVYVLRWRGRIRGWVKVTSSPRGPIRLPESALLRHLEQNTEPV